MNESVTTSKQRNIQLDFFRGVALLVIFVNHIPFNDLSSYTPSRFGFSDAAETSVFLSGFAAAIAYGRCFERFGLWLGIVRVLYRCSQIYVAHLTLFFHAGRGLRTREFMGGRARLHTKALHPVFLRRNPGGLAQSR